MYLFSAQLQTPHKAKVNDGYTLIELLASIVIIAVVFSVGTASFRGYQKKQYSESIARNILADVRLAQEFALSGKVSECPPGTYLGYSISGNSDEDRYFIQAACNLGGPQPTFMTPYKEVAAPAGYNIQVRGPNTNNRYIIFESQAGGIRQANTACVYLKQNSVTVKRISVTATGVVDFVNLCAGS